MTVNELAQSSEMRVIALPDPDKSVSGVYIGDLLSWVMGRAQANDAWITIMSNVNVVAVASLTDAACVIFAEGVVPEESVVQTAAQKGINLLSSEDSAYGIALRLHALLS